MEDRTIKPLDDVAEAYAEIRDQRMELTEREHALKVQALKLMKKYDKTIYRHDTIEITVVPGEEDVKVRVKRDKPEEDEGERAAAEEGARITDGEFGEERRAAVDSAE